jgi:hypothetical protein
VIVREIRDFVWKYAPTVICVVETQIHKKRVESLASTLGYDRAFVVRGSGRKGGIGMFCNNNIEVEIMPYSQYHLDTIIKEPGGYKWRLYGEAQTHEKHKACDMLKYIRSSSDLPWMLLGDFNKVLHQHEHSSLTSQSHSQMEGFREVMDVCGLTDLGYKGKWWTY